MIYLYLIATILVFLVSRKLLIPIKSPLANPLLVSILFFIGLFSFTPLIYQDYATANLPFIWLLEPAVVALAIPLFSQIKQIKKQFRAIMISCCFGVVIAISTCLSTALLLTDDKILLLSLLPKSVTSPIAMAIANETGGLASLAAAVVIAVGLLGALGGFSLLNLCKITNPQAQGLAMGCSAHAIGTAKAIEVGNEQGAFSSLALVISGILTAVLAPLFAWLIGIIITI
ncbi:MAG: CidB/LrgB family autolysis modulator [Gammaproteobacteria bacterium]|nr:MAG: CidB/LrgB family autolysis modulator [Gammaproteobacteria bacterium]PHR83454.1 MAG: CidB/LrgB family autolysis modulator [Colwellia sp.]